MNRTPSTFEASAVQPTSPPKPALQRVLIADDDLHVRQLLELMLQGNGYEIIGAANGHELVQLAQQFIPDIILVDLMMPQMDGYEAIRQLRNDTRTAHIPTLILTARAQTSDVVTGFETGADDYISKPFDSTELVARVKSHLRRATQRPVRNPLSGLPGGALLIQHIRHLLQLGQPLALLHADLDNFKAFNDIYGFSRGDRALLMVARVVQEALAAHGMPEDFIGHIGGDDFAVLTTPDCAVPICQAIIDSFDREVRQFYNPDDWARGYLSGIDRYGILRRFKLMTISIGVVTTRQRTFADDEELAHVAAEVKHVAKAQPGSSYAIDKRVMHLRATADRRSTRQWDILLASSDNSLRTVLHTALSEHHYAIYETTTVTNLDALLNNSLETPMLMLADAQLGQPLWDFCTHWSTNDHPMPIVVLTHDDEETLHALQTGATLCLQQPLPLADVVSCVIRLMFGANRSNETSLHALYE